MAGMWRGGAGGRRGVALRKGDGSPRIQGRLDPEEETLDKGEE